MIDESVRLCPADGEFVRDTSPAGTICVDERILVEQCGNSLEILECNRGKLEFLTQKGHRAGTHGSV